MTDLTRWLILLAAAWALALIVRGIVAARRVGYLLAVSCWLYRWAHNWGRLAEGFDQFACRWYALTGRQPVPECDGARRAQA